MDLVKPFMIKPLVQKLCGSIMRLCKIGAFLLFRGKLLLYIVVQIVLCIKHE